ncbi:MAG: 23S rRNA (adenine(2030)-N(6))-methyltransferase RlmJ [Roseobacter sp.]
MLSYQHIYHAGNLADVHKHALLAWMLRYLTRKDKPLTYIETHAGRGLYDLRDPAAQKTGEAAQGINKAAHFFPPDHPFAQVLAQLRVAQGPDAYPGSPFIAASLLRPDDRIHLAELHPAEYDALSFAMSPFAAKCYKRDGFELAHSLCPPTPRRGLILIDPSFELKTDYNDIPKHIARISKAWNVGVICLWYPILKVSQHQSMLRTLEQAHPDALRHEVFFAPAQKNHGMIGSGMFVIQPPFGLEDETNRLARHFAG